MTTIKLYTINCDGYDDGRHTEGCPMWVGNSDTAAEALREARAAGWISERLGGFRSDYSPQCWKKR